MRQQQQQQHQPTTIAIVGADTLVEDILVRLLQNEDCDARLLEAYPTGLVDELPDGADVLLLAPGLKDGMREAFLELVRSTPETEAIPVLPLSAALKQALLDELSAILSWRSLLKELVHEIETTLRRVTVLPVVGSEEPPWEITRSEAV